MLVFAVDGFAKRKIKMRVFRMILIAMVLLTFGIVTNLTNGMQGPQEQPVFNCLYPSNSNCAGYVPTNCNNTCTATVFGVIVTFACKPPDGQPSFTDQVLNSYDTVVESEVGFCDEGPPQNPVFCLTEYVCNSGCDELSDVGNACARNPGLPAGVQVLPHSVDYETMFCPGEFCDN